MPTDFRTLPPWLSDPTSEEQDPPGPKVEGSAQRTSCAQKRGYACMASQSTAQGPAPCEAKAATRPRP